jgi:hypothetical protein
MNEKRVEIENKIAELGSEIAAVTNRLVRIAILLEDQSLSEDERNILQKLKADYVLMEVLKIDELGRHQLSLSTQYRHLSVGVGGWVLPEMRLAEGLNHGKPVPVL